ncbi:MAG: hypothetical protein FJZ01_28000 [Candidatus Sericytochromatia bacterium]|nr:hypothetical protein [Candidatus Tanganyikabacteria bacterium]
MANPATREQWRVRLAAFDRGSTPVAEFCRRAGVSVASFYLWRRKLRQVSPNRSGKRGNNDSAPSRSGPTRRIQAAAPELTFLPLELTGRAGIEVHFPNGARILLPSQDRQALSAVVAALTASRREVEPC